jgi:hypothetical protein
MSASIADAPRIGVKGAEVRPGDFLGGDSFRRVRSIETREGATLRLVRFDTGGGRLIGRDWEVSIHRSAPGGGERP